MNVGELQSITFKEYRKLNTDDLEEMEQEGEKGHNHLALDVCMVLFLMMVVGNLCKKI